ncbi:hypothetical protein GCM10022600_08080 [Qipengyuania pelagi]|uniref:Glycosyltransferase n=1 Tax=Qipengyuania pelagi TaxID=994320 RepID=A0A844YAB5_9SPHN|nr:glycosyltransferase family 4 protein [Qipengyuania pelagi]MXO54317.1 glycosyltransferase [Qipengyuania pelagi]
MTSSERPVATIVSKQRLLGSTNGSSTYLLSIARSIEQAGYEIHLIQPSPAIAGRTPLMRFLPEMRVFAEHKIRGAVKTGSRALFLSPKVWTGFMGGAARLLLRKIGIRGSLVADRKAPYAVASDWSSEDIAFLASAISPRTRLIVADYIFCAPAFEFGPPDVSRATVMHDLFHSRAGGGADSVAIISREREIALLAEADAIFAIQEAEAAFCRETVPDTETVLVPMPAEPVERVQEGSDDLVLFVGSDTAPNIVGLEWFLDSVWPHVRTKRPDCRLKIAGTVHRAFAGRAWDGVDFLGLVDDLGALYTECGVVISPLTFGSGLKIKLVEALARGKAVIATSVTLQGVEDICRDAVIQTDDATIFADALVDLAGSSHSRRDLAQRALTCAQRNFSPDTTHRDLRNWCEKARA